MKKLLITLLLSVFAIRQPTTQSFSEIANSKVETLAELLTKQANLPGLSVAVNKNGKIVYAQGFGFADIKKETPMTASTQLRTGSVAKIITATAVAKLVSEGKLDLDAPIKTYVPYINKTYAMLTTRQLAGHTSGLPHRPKGRSYQNKQFDNIRETVELMSADLLFEPDTDYSYSTHGSNFIAAVIEGASKKDYETYMQEEIFAPLGMTQTATENIKNLTSQDASLYYQHKGKLRKEKITNGSYKIPGASFRTTPTDLVKLTKAYNNDFIDNKTVEEMFRSHELKNGKKTKVGIAWRSSVDAFGNNVMEHAGSWRGARTVLVYYPAEKLSISLMTNTNCQLFIEETAHIIAQQFRASESSNSPIGNIKESIRLTFFGSEKTEEFEGHLSLKNGEGILTTESNGFLKSNPVLYLGAGNDYALITSYGIIYLRLEKYEKLAGKGYLYSTMNLTSPVDGKPTISIKSK